MLAEEIRVADLEGEFAVRGAIESLVDTTVTIEGLVLGVAANVEIFDEEGNPLLFSDLLIAQQVRVSGDIDDGELTTTKIRVRIRDEALVRISFEGVIVEVADDLNSFMVELEAVGNVLVHLTGETETTGDWSSVPRCGWLERWSLICWSAPARCLSNVCCRLLPGASRSTPANPIRQS